MVCKDLDAAAAASARAPHLSCCTPKGDQVGKKGTVTGGYLDPTRSFLPALPKQTPRCPMTALKQTC